MKTKLCALALLLMPASAFAQQGALPPAPKVSVEPREVSLSSGSQPADQKITVKNVGSAPLDLRAIRIAAGSEGWQLTTRFQPQTLAPGGSVEVGVGFRPDGKHRQSFGALQVISNDATQ